MASNDEDLKIFEMELNNNLRKILNDNLGRTHLNIRQKYIKELRSQAQNEIFLGGTDYLDMNKQSDLHYNSGMDVQTIGNAVPSPGGYHDMELNRYYNFDSNIDANPREDLETRRSQSLDDFFHDFNEIISSEMKATPTTVPYDQGHHGLAINSIPSYSDQSNGCNSTLSAGVDYNLDLTQFYINANNDFLNPDDLKTDFSNGLIHYPPPPPSQYTYQNSSVVNDSSQFSVLDLSTGSVLDLSNSKMDGNVEHNSTTTSQSDTTDEHLQCSMLNHSDPSTGSNQMADYADTKISVSTPLNQFYLDFKLKGESAGGASNDNNSIVTYISKNAVQSVEYINESGQTETVMYVDQQPDDGTVGDGRNAFTQYEIINIDEYPSYNTAEHVNALQNTNSNIEMFPNNSSVPFYGDGVDVGPQTDILSTLLSDKNNKITIISKPMRNPKVRQSTDEFYLKFEEIDSNPTNIPFVKRPTVKGCRKQKLETINQIDSEVVEPKRSRSKAEKTIIPTTMTTTTTTCAKKVIMETPKIPSKFMRDRRNRMQTKRKRPRKLFANSESDCENGGSLINRSND